MPCLSSWQTPQHNPTIPNGMMPVNQDIGGCTSEVTFHSFRVMAMTLGSFTATWCSFMSRLARTPLSPSAFTSPTSQSTCEAFMKGLKQEPVHYQGLCRCQLLQPDQGTPILVDILQPLQSARMLCEAKCFTLNAVWKTCIA